MTAWVCGLISLASYLADTLALRMLLTTVFILAGNLLVLPFLLPLFNLVTVPLQILYGGIVRMLVFPLRSRKPEPITK